MDPFGRSSDTGTPFRIWSSIGTSGASNVTPLTSNSRLVWVDASITALSYPENAHQIKCNTQVDIDVGAAGEGISRLNRKALCIERRD